MTTIAFDIDGTLLNLDDTPNWRMIYTLIHLSWIKENRIYVWSGSGLEYANRFVEKFGLTAMIADVVEKASFVPDIAFDDQEVTLGKVNVKV